MCSLQTGQSNTLSALDEMLALTNFDDIISNNNNNNNSNNNLIETRLQGTIGK